MTKAWNMARVRSKQLARPPRVLSTFGVMFGAELGPAARLNPLTGYDYEVCRRCGFAKHAPSCPTQAKAAGVLNRPGWVSGGAPVVRYRREDARASVWQTRDGCWSAGPGTTFSVVGEPWGSMGFCGAAEAMDHADRALGPDTCPTCGFVAPPGFVGRVSDCGFRGVGRAHKAYKKALGL
jgi:hypothetical protein